MIQKSKMITFSLLDINLKYLHIFFILIAENHSRIYCHWYIYNGILPPQECDPTEEYEWEYMDSEEEKNVALNAESNNKKEEITDAANRKSSKDTKSGKQNQQKDKSEENFL